MHILTILLILISSNAQAIPWQISYKKTFPRQVAHCRFAGKSFSFEVRGATKDMDMEEKAFGSPYLFLKQGNRTQLVFQDYVNNYGEFLFAKAIPGDGSPCKEYRAFPLGPHILAVPFWQNGRPFSDDLHILLYDAKAGSFLGVTPRFGGVKEIEPHEGSGFSFLSVIQRSDLDLQKEKVNEEELELREQDLGLWTTVVYDSGEIQKDFDRDLTWIRSSYRRFFKTKESFLDAVDLRNPDARNPRMYVYFGKGTKEECVVFSKRRQSVKSPDNRVFCRPLLN